ncbi:serine hydrolase domain-containing protein [Vibrio sonorensis]|uniref:serine hydrolase domain-containing protein n=1 Tax=Vibrio sonorensis TaxID=1004316 RepID=UPI0015869311|nr:serine hydrolase domain-containing protein [Vibrio sonorensis]
MALITFFYALTFVSSQCLAEDSLDKIVNRYVAAYDVPSLSVVVTRVGKPVVAQSYGREGLLSPNTPTYVASISKSVTSAAIFLLKQKKKIDINDPVSQYIPEIAFSSTVTIKNLLEHTSGIRNFSYKYDFNGRISRKEAIEQLSGYQPESEPNKEFFYNNTNYDLLGLIIERVTGQTFSRFISENIFVPVGMNYSSTVASGDVTVPGYNNFFGYHWQREEKINAIESPSGFVISSAADVAKFMEFVRTGKSQTGAQLIDLDNLGLWHSLDEEQNYGLGLQHREFAERDMIGHYGSLFTHSSAAWVDPNSGIAVSLVANKVSIPLLTVGIPNLVTDIVDHVGSQYTQPFSYLHLLAKYYPVVIFLEILISVFGLVKLKKKLRKMGVDTKQKVGALINLSFVCTLPVIIAFAMGRVPGYVWLWNLAPDLFMWFIISVLLCLIKVGIVFRAPRLIDNKRVIFATAD